MYLLLICILVELCSTRLVGYFSSLLYLLLLEHKLHPTHDGCWHLGAAYHWLGRVRHCRSGRWPSSLCSNGHCFWARGYCSGDRQTVLLPHMSENTGPRNPRIPSCHGSMSKTENRRYFNWEARKTFKMYIWKSHAFNDSVECTFGNHLNSVARWTLHHS